MVSPQDFLKNCGVDVWQERYVVAKARRVPDTFVAVFNDQDEITVVAEENGLAGDWVIDAERGWKLVSFRTVLPLKLTGFLAVVATALAEEQISIFVLSSYTTDHLLVKESALASALRRLAALGCNVPTL